MTYKELSQLKHLNKEIEIQRELIKELRKQVSTVSLEEVHISNRTDLSNIVIKIEHLEKLLNENISKRAEQIEIISNFINNINDSYIRNIFTLKYINCYSWREVARKCGMHGEDTVRKAHDRWLKKNPPG